MTDHTIVTADVDAGTTFEGRKALREGWPYTPAEAVAYVPDVPASPEGCLQIAALLRQAGGHDAEAAGYERLAADDREWPLAYTREQHERERMAGSAAP